ISRPRAKSGWVNPANLVRMSGMSFFLDSEKVPLALLVVSQCTSSMKFRCLSEFLCEKLRPMIRTRQEEQMRHGHCLFAQLRLLLLLLLTTLSLTRTDRAAHSAEYADGKIAGTTQSGSKQIEIHNISPN